VRDGRRDVSLQGEHGVLLKGTINDGWGEFRVNEVHGILTGPTGDRAVGAPGGPLAVYLGRATYSNPGLHYGYVLDLRGWLPRNPCAAVPSLCS
jgi:hypothetical protein